MQLQNYFDQFARLLWFYAPKALLAVLLFMAGWWLIGRIVATFGRFLIRRQVDASLRPFFSSLADTGLKVLLVVLVANTVGIATTSFIAVFSAVAFSVGLALQGSLGNFASGVLILLFRPFKVGDFLTVADKHGRVAEIQIFSTILLTASGKRIIIPNGKILEGPIENVAEGAAVQAEAILFVVSSTPLALLRSTVEAVAARLPHPLPEHPTTVDVDTLTRRDMRVTVGVWTLGEHVDSMRFLLYEHLQQALPAAGIELVDMERRTTA